jgi:hypothetical protein
LPPPPSHKHVTAQVGQSRRSTGKQAGYLFRPSGEAYKSRRVRN